MFGVRVSFFHLNCAIVLADFVKAAQFFKLKMSLASIKVKETKGKQKSLPKLKTILANPYNEKCPTLDDEQLELLGQWLRSAIRRSKKEPRAFAIQHHICLGLESTLRAINKSACGCVLISFNLKPRHLIGLIARNVEIKNIKVPVYVHSQLEEFTTETFGIRASAFALPTENAMKQTKLNINVERWLEFHNTERAKQISKSIQNKNKAKIVAMKVKEKATDKLPAKIQKRLKEGPDDDKMEHEATDNDVISVAQSSSAMEVDEAGLTATDNDFPELKEPQKEEANPKVDKAVPLTASQVVDAVAAVKIGNENSTADSQDDFLPDVDYQPLTVNKIRANPNKKPKKKRKKKKQKKN